MGFLESLLDAFAGTSTGKNKIHIYKGKTGTYGKLGADSKGAKGKTLWYSKKK